MTSNDDSRDGKKPARSNISGKRPHATLDLTAVEIKDPAPSTTPASAKSSADDASPPPKSGADVKAMSSDTHAETPSQKTDSAERSDTREPKTMNPDKKTATAQTSDTTPPPQQIFKRRGGLIGPLVGGIVGGLLAVFAGDYAFQRLGLPKLAGSATQSMDAVELRLADLEQQLFSEDTSANGAKTGNANLDAIAKQLEDLKTLSKTTAGLVQRQAQLNDQVTALAAQSSAPTAPSAAVANRLDDLEQRIGNISNAGSDEASTATIADLTKKLGALEAAVANQTSSPAQGLGEEAETQLKDAVAAASTARADTARLDENFATVKSTTNRLDQRVEALKTEADKLSESIKILNESTVKMSSEISSLRTTLQTELSAVARPADINAAVTPYKDRIANLEAHLQALEKANSERAQQAKNVVLSLELANLQRTVNRGEPFAGQLQNVKASADSEMDLSALDKYANQGVPTLTTLQKTFRPLIHQILRVTKPDQDTSIITQLVDQAKSVVHIRRVTHDRDDTSVEAVVARMEENLKSGNLSAVLDHASALPDDNKVPAQAWLEQVTARTAVDAAMTKLQMNLKTTLSNASLTPRQ